MSTIECETILQNETDENGDRVQKNADKTHTAIFEVTFFFSKRS